MDYETRLATLENSLEEEAKERHASIIDIRKERFAAYLTEGYNVTTAGEKVGVSVATAYRYHDDPAVVALVQKWRDAIAAKAVRKMTRHLDDAIDTVVNIMTDERVSAQTRVQAAFGIMDRLGADVRVMRESGTQHTKVVIERLVQINTNSAADAQHRRAMGMVEDVDFRQITEGAEEGDYEVLEDFQNLATLPSTP